MSKLDELIAEGDRLTGDEWTDSTWATRALAELRRLQAPRPAVRGVGLRARAQCSVRDAGAWRYVPRDSQVHPRNPGGNMRAELERLVEELTERLRALRLGFAQSDGYVADGLMIARDELSRILTRSDWIPVSERLPDDGVLCWVMVCGIRGMYRWHDSLVKHGAEAWQPIEEPAPYRAEGGGGDCPSQRDDPRPRRLVHHGNA